MRAPNGGNADKPTLEADVWRDFHDQFQAIGEENQALTATCFYPTVPSAIERDLIAQGIFRFLERLERGAWTLEGNSERLKARYAALATRAGIQLGPPEGIRPLDYWLDALMRDTGGGIWNLCEDSATFCSRLEQKALETSRSAFAVALNKKGRGENWFDSDINVLRRRQIVLKNPKMRSKSLCKVFDTAPPRIPLPQDWQAELDVANWSEAYENPIARKRIQKMICTDRRAGRPGSS